MEDQYGDESAEVNVSRRKCCPGWRRIVVAVSLVLLVMLTVFIFFYVTMYEGASVANTFPNSLDAHDEDVSFALLECFHSLSLLHGIRYSIAYGSMFGAYCYGERLTFDDDFDLVVEESSWRSMLDAFGAKRNKDVQCKNHSLRIAADPVFGGIHKVVKIYSNQGKRQMGRPDAPWTTPFLDIAILECGKDAICRSPGHPPVQSAPGEYFPKNAPNPLTQFGRLTLPTAPDAHDLMKKKYEREPCEQCFPLAWNHMKEVAVRVRGPPTACSNVQRCSDGSLAPCCVRRALPDFPIIPLAERQRYRDNQRNQSLNDINTELCKELNTIELHNRANANTDNALTKKIKVSFWNAERGRHWRDALPHLNDSAIIFLNEVDVGMARSGNVNVAREMAAALGKHYVSAIEFIELTNDLPHEIAATKGETNSHGYHCNAILSDFPLHSPLLTRTRIRNWFVHGSEKRLGDRVVLQVKTSVGGLPLSLAVTHLDGSSPHVADALAGDISQRAIVVADWHINLANIKTSELATKSRFSFDVNNKKNAARTSGYADNGGTTPCAGRGNDHTHLFGLRNLEGTQVDIRTPTGSDGNCLSGSAFLHLFVDV